MMPQLMPRVDEKIVHTKIFRLGDRSYQQNLYTQIAQENPFLWKLIESAITDDSLDEGFKKGYCQAAVQFYDLLKTQMEINQLEDQEEMESINDK
jgi:hypothetical protein